MVQRVLNMATEGTDNPDLRDRGFIYWRLLSHSPQVHLLGAARSICFPDEMLTKGAV
jgi:vesicle coat complex subunit